MTLTVANTSLEATRASQANFVSYMTIDLDSSYPSGGYDMSTELDVVEGLLDHDILFVHATPTATYWFAWHGDTKKLAVHLHSTDAEVAGATDLSGVLGVKLTVFTQ
jgi:hypothetical protein